MGGPGGFMIGTVPGVGSGFGGGHGMAIPPIAPKIPAEPKSLGLECFPCGLGKQHEFP